MSINLNSVLVGADSALVGLNILPGATVQQPSNVTGSASNQVPANGLAITGGSIPPQPAPPGVPWWVWAGLGGIVLVSGVYLLNK